MLMWGPCRSSKALPSLSVANLTILSRKGKERGEGKVLSLTQERQEGLVCRETDLHLARDSWKLRSMAAGEPAVEEARTHHPESPLKAAGPGCVGG